MTEKEAIEDIIDTSLKEKSRGVCTISVEYLENIEKYLQTQQEEIEKKDKIVKSIISRLNNDIKNISETKSKKREHYLDDYTRCRLKAYKTKTREIKEYIEKEYFINKAEKENKDE